MQKTQSLLSFAPNLKCKNYQTFELSLKRVDACTQSSKRIELGTPNPTIYRVGSLSATEKSRGQLSSVRTLLPTRNYVGVRRSETEIFFPINHPSVYSSQKPRGVSLYGLRWAGLLTTLRCANVSAPSRRAFGALLDFEGTSNTRNPTDRD